MAGFSATFDACRSVLEEVAGDPERAESKDTSPFARLASALIESKAGQGAVRGWLSSLREAGLLQVDALAAISPAEVEAVLAGQLRTPRSRGLVGILHALAGHVVDLGGEAALEEIPTETLREEWRGIRGLGAATVDTLLAALGRPSYPLDRASYRILVRHGWVDETAGYDEARAVVEAAAPDSAHDLRLIASAFHVIGARWCKPSGPDCRLCPLAPWLPEGGAYLGADAS